MLATLDRFGVDRSEMQRIAGVPTSASILNIRRNGERPALHVRGASGHFEIPADARERVLAPPMVHLGGTGLLDRLDGEPSRVLLEEAKRFGRTTTFDLLGANDNTLSLIRPLFPFIDYFMPSVEEAMLISGQKTAEDAGRFFADLGVKHCIFTLGGDGVCFLKTHGKSLRLRIRDRRGRHHRLRRRLQCRLHRRASSSHGDGNRLEVRPGIRRARGDGSRGSPPITFKPPGSSAQRPCGKAN